MHIEILNHPATEAPPQSPGKRLEILVHSSLPLYEKGNESIQDPYKCMMNMRYSALFYVRSCTSGSRGNLQPNDDFVMMNPKPQLKPTVQQLKFSFNH